MTNDQTAPCTPWLREELDYEALPQERKDNIDIVRSAYASVQAPLDYLTMPVTTGRRYYEAMDRHGVRTLADLEAAKPGALREEVILPNIEESVLLGRAIGVRTGHVVVVPGVFEAHRQRWSQAEYMVLWLRLITHDVETVHLSPHWEYSNGGAVEYARAILARHGQVPGCDRPMAVVDHHGDDVPLDMGVAMLMEAADELERDYYDASVLRREVGRLAGMAAMLAYGDRHEYAHATRFSPLPHLMLVVRQVYDARVPVAFDLR